MKFLFVLCITLAATFAEKYDSNNDNIDIEGIIKNPAELKGLLDCFLDRGVCDEVAADFKKDLPEASKEACAKCTDAQKHIFNRFLNAVKEKVPQDYEAFKSKYDPEKKYFAALEQAIMNA